MIKIAIVDSDDNVIGSADKATARRQGQIHRIARIFIFNSQGQLLIQRRSTKKQDSPGKWDQSVAGHVDEGEDYCTAALREAREELGLDLENLAEVAKFYTETAKFDGQVKRFNLLYEATSDGEIVVDENEVAEVKWLSLDDLEDWMRHSPEDFTGAFPTVYGQYVASSTRQHR